MIINKNILEKTCKDMIETILFCLSDATKGTIYLVSPMPELQAVRVTSGNRLDGSDQIQWGLPEASDYNFPGKTWEQYRDRPGHVMEAMGWCVERQKSWTADDPYEDGRSVRKQLSGEIEDFHHMEPVLVRKSYLYGNRVQALQYALDYQGNPIWQDCEYVVVAVIKIHFRPYSIKRGDRSTKIIKKLSRTLGTELLSLHVRETLAEEQKKLARERLQSCNDLAHELRNLLIKFRFLFKAINTEIGLLRAEWESLLNKTFPELDRKSAVLMRLNELVRLHLDSVKGKNDLVQLGEALVADQTELAQMPILPSLGKTWLENKIRPKWKQLLDSRAWEEERDESKDLLDRLEKGIGMGLDEGLAMKMTHLPEDLKKRWQELAYVDLNKDNLHLLNEVIKFLDHPALDIPHKHQSKRVLIYLKVLAEIIPEISERADRIMDYLKNGSSCRDW